MLVRAWFERWEQQATRYGESNPSLPGQGDQGSLLVTTVQLTAALRALLSPTWQGPKNEYLTTETLTECAEKARRYNSIVKKEDPSKQPDSILSLPEESASGSAGTRSPKNKSWFFFFFARGNKYHWDLKQNKNTIEGGREIGSRMTSSLKSYLNSRLTIKTKTPSQIKWKQGRWFHLRVRNGRSRDIFTNNVSQDVNNLPSMLVFMTLTDILHIYSENQSSPIPSINNPQKIFCLHGQGPYLFLK